MLGYKRYGDDQSANVYVAGQKSFEAAELAGSEVSYWCISKNCKDIEAVDIKEEAEQSIINASVKGDL